jgi:hypothetical protein
MRNQGVFFGNMNRRINQKKLLFLVALLTTPFICNAQTASIQPVNLRCEFLENPLGVDVQNPVVSWTLSATNIKNRDLRQAAYQVLVATAPELLKKDEGDLWNSGKVASDRTRQITYTGKALRSGQKCWWKIKVWDASGKPSGWSETAAWQMGLLTSGDWGKAQWIGYEDLPDSMRIFPGTHFGGIELGNKCMQRPVIPLFRREFELKKKVASALLYITGLGQYEAYMNGIKVGNSFLTPGWTQYDKTILYNTYDVGNLIKPGTNAIGVIVGNGFYNINRERYRKLAIAYGMPKMICMLTITFTDGTEDIIESGSDWKTAPSPVTYCSIYGGEDYDARLEQEGWNKTGFADGQWKNALPVTPPKGTLRAELGYPVEVKDTISVKQIIKHGEGKYVYDFGQNASGIIELTVKGMKGRDIILTPGELLDTTKTPYQDASGKPYYCTYTLRGNGEEVWAPRFTYYGFRYVEVKGAVPHTEENDSLSEIIGMKFFHTRNSSPANGSFQCSDTLFNKIYSLIHWAIKSNFQSVLTDCPHREKLGWLEQTFLMGSSINYNFNIQHLYRKIVADMMDAQTVHGLVPDIAPEYVVFDGGFRDSPEWGSASIMLPWLLYKFYGDTATMSKAWPMMTKYVAYLGSKSDHHIVSHGLGDWYDIGPQLPGEAQLTPKSFTATCIYFYDVKLLSHMAGILNKSPDNKYYKNLSEEIQKAFNNKFFNEHTKVYSTGSQTAMSMPLCCGMVDEKYRAKVLDNLTDSIVAHGKALTAGDIGFHYLVQALTEGGASQLLFDMNHRTDVPGYGFQLKKGATALTESWQALEFVSNNHFMLGHVMEWLYSGIGGIRQDENSFAYRNIVIDPEIVGNITHAHTTFESPNGTILADWKKDESQFELLVEIPVNSNAKIYLPGSDISKVTENNRLLTQFEEIQFVEKKHNKIVLKVGSGKYRFTVKTY